MSITDKLKKAWKWILTDHRREMYDEWDKAFVNALNAEQKRRSEYRERLDSMNREELLREIAYHTRY